MAYSDLAPNIAREQKLRSPEELYRLGLRHSTGRGGAVDLVQAHMWFNLAALRGIEAAKRCRRELAEQMTRAQIAAAQRAAREWLAAAA